MQHKIINQGQCTVLQINEERFDARLAPDFRTQLTELSQSVDAHLIIDLTQVRFMDSSGLGAVMAGYKMLRGKKMSVVNPQRAVKELLKLTRMDQLITCYDSIDDAISVDA
ncbi:STAS domain-containing protein [Moritella sp. F3]|uniref:STAS domain-containing protein n=1 Tax=Moritella sp. F3 TaxID=2718882 RepID=UPI0018E1972A|nr:STAS domain-containing protein [Moritella sp. F3]GIC76828.1 anti-sigma factor antagonist [Moritella sp. F1]GIC81014.1 anti-sigma factor antagonist [Moritella sp. F3]